MNRFFAISLSVLITCGATVYGENIVMSPRGKFAIHFAVRDTEKIKGGLFWSVKCCGETILEESRLGFTLDDAPSLMDNFKIVSVARGSQNKTWKPVYGEASEYKDHYNELRVTVKDGQTPPRILTLDFRAYDEGVAYRVIFPKQKAFEKLTISSENTQFRLTGDHKAWITRNGQGRYSTKQLSELNPKHDYERPFMMKTEAGRYIAIAEAGNLDFPRMRIGLDKSASHAVKSRLSGSAVIQTPHTTPWRLVMSESTPGEILEHSYMFLNLSPPCKLAKTAWIKPGKQMRDVTITKKGGCAIVDFAAVAGLDYVEIDAGWYGDERNDAVDATTVTPSRSRGGFTEQDLHDLIAYAKSKGIGVIVYVNRRHLEKQIDQILPLYEKWGIAGMKFGFVNTGPQEWTQWLHDSMRKAGEFHMIVDVHDEYRPTGIERTYPNWMTSEGIQGNEGKPVPKVDIDNAFLRSLCGPADFTMCWQASSLKMSWAHQMAASIIYYSPLQTLYWYDEPKKFSGDEEYLAFFRALPTVWDEKNVIQGEIGEFITVARRKGDSWFVGTMNAIKHREAQIPLTFLDPGRKYTATIYADPTPEVEVEIDPSPRGKGNPESKKLKITIMDVTADTIIHADMANNGGQAIHITPTAKPQ